jgi:hypothetical protein
MQVQLRSLLLATLAALLAAPRGAGAVACRQANNAKHGWCGLPLEASNFQVWRW